MHLRGHERYHIARTEVRGQLDRTDAAAPWAAHIHLHHRTHRMPIDHYGLQQVTELGIDSYLSCDDRTHPCHQNATPLHRSALRIGQILQRNTVDGDSAAHTVSFGGPQRWIAPCNIGGTERGKYVEECHEEQSCAGKRRRTEVLTQS